MLKNRTLLCAILLATLPGCCLAESSPVDIAHSTLTIRVFKNGLFSGFAHNHEISAPLSFGTVDPTALSVEIHFDARKLTVLDPDTSAGDRAKVQETMLSDKVLDANRFTEIVFVSRSIKAAGGNAYTVEGNLTLHGVTQPLTFAASLANSHYTGSVKLKQTDFGITPISLFGGSVKVKDVIEITFDIVPQAK
ncbi:MAG: YceI family protein [Terriglobales bacterium]